MPPQVGKQTFAPPRPSALDRIAPISTKTKPLKVAVFGGIRSGKTRLLGTFPKPILIIGYEDGTQSLVGHSDIDFVLLDNTKDFQEVLRYGKECGKYNTIGLDNGTKMRDVRLTETLGLMSVPEQKSWGFANRDQYAAVANSLKDLWRPMLDIPRTHEINIVIIAQESNLNESELKPPPPPKYGPALGKSLADWLCAECDYIVETFFQPQLVKHIQAGPGGEKLEVVASTGKQEYCLRVAAHNLYYSGFRQELGAKSLPEHIVDPSYDKIMEAIKGTYVQS